MPHRLKLPQLIQSSWILRQNCLLCERPNKPGFKSCLCQRCTEQLDNCQHPQPLKQSPKRLVWGHYRDSLRHLIHPLKYSDQRTIAQLLGQNLAHTWQQQGFPQLIPQAAVVPIPIHPQRLQQRGFNQAELIAKRFCQCTGMSCQPKILRRIKATKAQHGLSVMERRYNLLEAFTVMPHQTQHPIILVDDIYTTGITIDIATQALEQAGYQVWGSAIVAD